jgi:predicted Fe-Mo cluster-binding NifX family protein
MGEILMKIAIPADNKSLGTSVCQSFGRAPYFLLYDTESKETVLLENEAAASQGGAGIKAAQAVVDCKAQAVLTVRCGKNAADVIKAANIKIYKTIDDSAQKNIDAFCEGKLALLEDFHAGFHG